MLVLLLAVILAGCVITVVLDIGFVRFKAAFDGQVHATVKTDFTVAKGAELVGMIAAKRGETLAKPRIKIRSGEEDEVVVNLQFGRPENLIAHCDALEAEIRASLADPNLAAELTYRCGFAKATVGIDLRKQDAADFLVDPPADTKICAMAGGRAEDCTPTAGGGCEWGSEELLVVVNPDCIRSGLTKSPSCIQGSQPSASLLVPYFEVDLAGPGGVTTLVAVKNESSTCDVARVTLWTDLGVPTLTFYMRLLPDDIQTFNLRDLFNGQVPATNDALFDDRCPVLDFDPCQAVDLAYRPSQAEVAGLRADHTGAANPSTGDCAGIERGDSVAVGYLTVDLVNRCSYPPTVATWQEFRPPGLIARLIGPDLPGAGYLADLADRNGLTGDVIYAVPDENFAQGDEAVSIGSDPSWFEQGSYTFYGALNGFDGSDGRMPLSSQYAVRVLEGGAFDGGTRLLVWRDSRQTAPERVECGTFPSWFPLGSYDVRISDEDATELYHHRYDRELLDFCADGATPTGGVAFSCQIEPAALGLSTSLTGDLSIDLSHGDGAIAQGWVSATHSAFGRFSVGHGANRLDDLCQVWLPGSAAFP